MEEDSTILSHMSLIGGSIALLMLAKARHNAHDAEAARQKALEGAGSSGEKKKGAAGHAGNFEQDGFFYKLEVKNRFENERAMLQRLASDENEPMRPFAPEFHGVQEIDGKRFLKMKTLTAGFDTSTMCLMDVKMGLRCFAESELQSKKPREDLYERLCTMDAKEPTPEEIAARAITKARWMLIRDHRSSTSSLGFRVDAVITPERSRQAFGDLWTVKEDAQIVDVLNGFLPEQCNKAARKALVKELLAKLEDFEAALRASTLFSKCEVIGSSLLFAADANGKLGRWMLDFGLTGPCPTGNLKHDVEWVEGNHEDGYLTGVSNLRRLWGKALTAL